MWHQLPLRLERYANGDSECIRCRRWQAASLRGLLLQRKAKVCVQVRPLSCPPRIRETIAMTNHQLFNLITAPFRFALESLQAMLMVAVAASGIIGYGPNQRAGA